LNQLFWNTKVGNPYFVGYNSAMLPHIPARAKMAAKPTAVGKESVVPRPPTVSLAFDGSCNPNPGPMGIGYELSHGESRVLVEVGAQIGQGTNNEAEYHALLAGLRHALRLGFWTLAVRSDSLLVVSQVNGQWKVKDHRLRKLHAEAVNLVRLFTGFSLQHVRREENAVADQLSRMLVFHEPTLPLPGSGTRFQRALLDWQAAAVRVWWLNHNPGAYTLARVFGVDPVVIEQIGHGKSYRDATFGGYTAYIDNMFPPQSCEMGLCGCQR
jgi:ribonuclease HI